MTPAGVAVIGGFDVAKRKVGDTISAAAVLGALILGAAFAAEPKVIPLYPGGGFTFLAFDY